jgi:hypothetical protein
MQCCTALLSRSYRRRAFEREADREQEKEGEKGRRGKEFVPDKTEIDDRTSPLSFRLGKGALQVRRRGPDVVRRCRFPLFPLLLLTVLLFRSLFAPRLLLCTVAHFAR